MKITNFREYTAVLREIYTGDAMHETGQYYHALMASGKELKEKKAELQSKIRLLNEEIQKQAAKIRESSDKRAAGLEMLKIKKAKQQLVILLKDLQNSDHFNVLSEEAKTCVCSGFLLQKYLTRELTENNPLNFPINNNGNLVVNTDTLRHSEIFQEAGHIKDFVAAYIARNPEKVKTPGHFKTILNGITNWEELLDYADNFFETLNDSELLEEGPIKASRLGTEVIKLFPEQNLQLVRLHTEKALDYESEKMKHCVGKGSYDKGVKSGKTHIYSIRDINPDGEWLPHVTIEYTNGKIKQVKGFANNDVQQKYISVVRRAVFHIIGSSDIVHLAQEQKISDLSKWGYILDTDNKPHDIYNIREDIHLSTMNDTDSRLTLIPPQFICLDTIELTSSFNEETINFLRRFKKIAKIKASFSLKIETPQKARELLFSFLGDLSNETILKRTDGILWNKLGYILDADKQLQDLLNLKEEIHIKSIYQNSSEFLLIPPGLVSADEVVLSDIDAKNFMDILHKFKNIKRLNIATDAKIKDPLAIRKILSEYFSDKDYIGKINDNFSNELGFQKRWDPQKTPFTIELTAPHTFSPSKESSSQNLVDIINPDKTEHIKSIRTSSALFPLIDHGSLIFKTVKIDNAITPETIRLLNNLKGIHYLDIEEADCTELHELDLRNINFLPHPKPKAKESSPFTEDTFFLEGFTIPVAVSDRAVSIRKSKNLPTPENIKFPSNVKHIMIEMDTEDKLPAALPDFRLYPELETIQLNNMDLSEADTIYIPQNVKYLAFYNCRFGQGINMDLSGYKKLEELRLNKCDLKGVDNFAFPPNLKKLSAQEAILKTGVKLPKVKNMTQQDFMILNNTQIVLAR